MNIKKLIFIIIIIAAIGGVATYIYSEVAKSKKTLVVDVVVLSFNNDKSTIDEINDKSINMFKSHENMKFEKIIINLYSQNGKIDKFELIPPGGLKNRTKYLDDFKTTMKTKLINEFSSSIEFANRYLETISQNIANKNENEVRDIMLLGSFPIGYASEESAKAINIIRNNLKSTNFENCRLYWAVRSNMEEPEESVLKYFKTVLGDKNVKDMKVVVPPRVNITKKAYLLSYNPLNSDLSNMFIKSLLQQSRLYTLTVIADGAVSGAKVILNNKNSDSVNNYFSKLPKADWTSTGALLRQLKNLIATQNKGEEVVVYFAGSIPPHKYKDQIFAQRDWEVLKNYPKLKFYFLRTKNERISNETLVFQDGLKQFNINYETITF